jgi:antagonist of KipI
VSVIVLRGGLATSVQDCGARGLARLGVPERGALDGVSARLASMLVGNGERDALLEMAFDGPELLFEDAALVALCGAEMAVSVDGVSAGMARPIAIRRGSVLRCGGARRGARAYLAIAGGIDVPDVLGGRGTHTGASFGGFDGRILRAGDRLVVTRARDVPHESARWSVSPEMLTPLDPPHTIRCVVSREHGEHAQRAIGRVFTVAPQSDRMGVRFVESIGPHERAIVSEPTVLGAMQLPPDGRPIVLMNDHQTTGGYPVIAHVATIDLPALAQVRPGASVRFAAIDLDRADRLHAERELSLRRMHRWIALQRDGR